MDFKVAFPALVLGRLLLAFSPLSNVLRDDHLLSSPLTAYSRLQEGIFLFSKGIDPYSGGPFHHSPLYLSVFSTVVPTGRWVPPVLWTLSDVIGAWALVRMWRLRQGTRRNSRDALVAALYLLNPYVFLSTLSLSTATFENTLVLLSLMFGCEGLSSERMSLLLLSFATHISLPCLLLLPAVVLLLLSSPAPHLASPRLHPLWTATKDVKTKAALLVGEYVLYTAALFVASQLVTGGWGLDWIRQTWSVGLLLTDLTPNVGLWWYFFTEMFDHFRPFFLMVFSVHLFIYVPPICIKFQHDPLYAAFLITGVLATFKPYPTLADHGLFLSAIALFPEIYPHLRHPLPTALLHVHSALLLPLFHHLWLVTGTGNANFFYASTLVFGVANGAALIDVLWAGLRIAVGKGMEGKDIAVVQE